MDETRIAALGQKKLSSILGFTLIELLIVIAIIAILAAIVIPVVSEAREAGRRTTCQGNQRQIAAAMQQYVQDYDGRYPNELFAYHTNSTSTVVTWREVLATYAKNQEIFRCPSQGKATSESDYHGDGYDYNAQRLNTFQWSAGPIETAILTIDGMPESNLATPSTIWLTGDRVAIENQQCVDCASSIGPCGHTHYGGTVHNKGGNYSFVDGHVQWFTPNAIAAMDCQNNPLPSSPQN